LLAAGFSDVKSGQRQVGGVEVDFTGRDTLGRLWLFEVAGRFSGHRGGLKRSDVVWRAVGVAAVLWETSRTPLVLLTTDRPRGGAGSEILEHMTGPGKPIHAVIELLKPSGTHELRDLCHGGAESPSTRS
jgi:hypothetical protein